MFYSSTFLMLGGLHTLLCDGGLKKSRLVIFSSQIISCSANLEITFNYLQATLTVNKPQLPLP